MVETAESLHFAPASGLNSIAEGTSNVDQERGEDDLDDF